MLNFGKKFGIFCFLDNHGYEFDKSYECVAGAGVVTSMIAIDAPGLDKLNEFQRKNHDWIFGHIAYDVKNEIEHGESANPDGIGFPDIYFFVPEIVFLLQRDELQIGVGHASDAQKIYEAIISHKPEENTPASNTVTLKSRFPLNEYIDMAK